MWAKKTSPPLMMTVHVCRDGLTEDCRRENNSQMFDAFQWEMYLLSVAKKTKIWISSRIGSWSGRLRMLHRWQEGCRAFESHVTLMLVGHINADVRSKHIPSSALVMCVFQLQHSPLPPPFVCVHSSPPPTHPHQQLEMRFTRVHNPSVLLRCD